MKHRALESARQLLKTLTLSPAKAAQAGWAVNQDGRVRTAWEYLSYKDIDLHALSAIWPEVSDISEEIGTQVEIEALYSSYLERQADYSGIGGLSNEVRQKLESVRPSTLGQAGRIEGVTPGALTALLGYVKRRKKAG